MFGGMNPREIGSYVSILSDGEKQYLEYSVFLNSGYVEINEDSYKLIEGDLESDTLNEVEEATEIVMSGQVLETFGDNTICKEGYEFLSEELFACTNEYKNFECLILHNGDEIYGAVNCYYRPSGRSGNFLSHENFAKSFLIEAENGHLVIEKEHEGAAILAFNQSHYVMYTNKTFYSVDKESEKKIELCKDEWWDNGPTFYSNVKISFTDNIFMICGEKGTLNANYITLIVGNINGSHFETLINHQKIEN